MSDLLSTFWDAEGWTKASCETYRSISIWNRGVRLPSVTETMIRGNRLARELSQNSRRNIIGATQESDSLKLRWFCNGVARTRSTIRGGPKNVNIIVMYLTEEERKRLVEWSVQLEPSKIFHSLLAIKKEMKMNNFSQCHIYHDFRMINIFFNWNYTFLYSQVIAKILKSQ